MIRISPRIQSLLCLVRIYPQAHEQTDKQLWKLYLLSGGNENIKVVRHNSQIYWLFIKWFYFTPWHTRKRLVSFRFHEMSADSVPKFGTLFFSVFQVILMSATVDADKFSTFFHHCPVISVPGRTFPVRTLHLEEVLELTPSYSLEEDSPYAQRFEHIVEVKKLNMWYFPFSFLSGQQYCPRPPPTPPDSSYE